MRPPDALTGWDDQRNAELYDRFTRDFPFYTQTSRDLAARADLGSKELAVDLCGGTGATAAVILDAMPPHGRVISVDASTAMQEAGRRSRPHPRITWVVSRAEDLAERVAGPVDAVLCNAAIWKTDTPATFAAVKRILRPGGRFVFNIGGGFAGLAGDEDQRSRRTPSLNDLINAIAVRDYGHVPQKEQAPQEALTADIVQRQLQDAGFTVLARDVITCHGTAEEKRAWLSIPVFARPPDRLTHQQRMEILQKAYQEADKTRTTTTRWLLVTAQA
ncbi:MAG TPA: class I SAM-dependent methyltransferase [Streptosporangiaceae bacterium]|nr:class I SAM-dependent methyltransferase [Streptosporangiaceae bacterium]